MRKLTRKNLDELAKIMPVLNENVQRAFIGGGNGSENNPYTQTEYDEMLNNGTWQGGYVDGWGYTFGTVTVTGNHNSSSNNDDTSGNHSSSNTSSNEWGGSDSGFWNAFTNGTSVFNSNSDNW